MTHAWDCRCGTRNAPSFLRCRDCGAPAATGRPVPPQGGSPAGRPVPGPPAVPARRPAPVPSHAVSARVAAAHLLLCLQGACVVGVVVTTALLCPGLLILLLLVRGGGWFHGTLERIGGNTR